MVILGGMGNVWGVIARRRVPRVPRPRGAREHRLLDQRQHPCRRLAPEPRRAALLVRDLRGHHRARDALPARGPDALETPRRRAARGRPRRAALRRDRTRATDAPTTTTSSSRTRLRKEFGGLVAVNDVDFVVPRGKIVSLIGPNGAGKTTFFNMLTGVYKPTERDDRASLGEDVTGKPPHAITSAGIGRTFQNIRLFKNMTTLENVLVGMHSRLQGEHLHLDPSDARRQARGGRGARAGARAAALLGPAAARGRGGGQPAVRRPAPARGRAGARDRAEAAAARRADRRHEPAGVRRLHRASCGSCATSAV